MGLDAISLEMIGRYVNGAAVLCLGYPEIQSEAAETLIERHLGVKPRKFRAGGLTRKTGKELPDTVDTFLFAGAQAVDVVDVIQHFGMERLVDLNQQQEWPRNYGLVINPGTLEHCFNIGFAWASVWRAVGVGGRVLHVMPATMLNHGFWNISPVAVNDWCAANGGVMEAMRFGVNGTTREIRPESIGSGGSGRGKLEAEAVMYALCRKDVDRALQWPVQGAYRR